MKVAVNKFQKLGTGRTTAAGIAIAVTAKDVVGKRNGYCKLAVPTRAGYEQGVCKAVLVDTTFQLCDNTLLPYYIFKENTHRYIAFAISYTLSKALRV